MSSPNHRSNRWHARWRRGSCVIRRTGNGNRRIDCHSLELPLSFRVRSNGGNVLVVRVRFISGQNRISRRVPVKIVHYYWAFTFRHLTDTCCFCKQVPLVKRGKSVWQDRSIFRFVPRFGSLFPRGRRDDCGHSRVHLVRVGQLQARRSPLAATRNAETDLIFNAKGQE